MRIAFLVTTFPSLSQTFVLGQITGLIDRGCQVAIYALQPAETAKVHPEVKTYRLCEQTTYLRMPDNYVLRLLKGLGLLVSNVRRAPRVLLRSLNIHKYGERAASLRLLYEAIACLGREPYDVIHCHFGPNGLSGAMLRDIGAMQGKLVTTFYGYDLASAPHQSRHPNYDFLFQAGNLFIAISETMRRQLVELGCDENKILVHRIGVDSDRFSPPARRLPGDGRVRIVTIARLIAKKGVEYGIRAVAQLLKVHRNLTYTIVGDGPWHRRIQQLIQESDLGDAVRLVGWKRQPAIVDVLNGSDILLAPSVTGEDGDQEGTPMVLMEALAMGLPVVSTRHSGIPEVVENGVSGCLVPERDVDAMVKALAYLIEHPEVRGEMGRAGRETIKEQYNIDRLNDQLIEIYRELLADERVRLL